jgi:hypothetical protein
MTPYRHLRPEDFKVVNRDAFLTSPDYNKSDPYATPADTDRAISRVRNGDLQTLIDAVFTDATIARLNAIEHSTEGQRSLREILAVVGPLWAKHMALHAGMHHWPDANHRTAIMTFNMALERHLGLNVHMDDGLADMMLLESKQIRRTLLRQGLLKPDLLAAPGHPYHKLYRDNLANLDITDDVSERKGLLYRRN